MHALRLIIFALVSILVAGTGAMIGAFTASLPSEDGKISLFGLSSKATVTSDVFGIPSISADDRSDAYHVLGFLHARDRLFQMEVMRRKSAGRLAELFGASAIKIDRSQRGYRLAEAARNIVNDLPADQRQILQAYVEGVNAYIDQANILPPEFLALRHQPERWTMEDSVLVILGMYQILNGHEQDERMVSVMEKALPADLVKFLTPDTDEYSVVLVGGASSRRHSSVVPVQSLASLPKFDVQLASNSVDVDQVVAGSNNWVVAGSKTADGRAIVANDMHLRLSVPNVWYRADLNYQGRHVFGVTLPGVPAVVVGANDNVAWGFTNVTGDFVDLVRLEVNPDNPNEYRTPTGWKEFTKHKEIICVKGAQAVEFTSRSTIWGPVSEQLLMGQPVAVKWVALQPHAVDLGLLDMDTASTTEQAMTVMNHAGTPPQNVVIADRAGHIGWTYMGRFPRRIGFDGLVSRSWADGSAYWQGYIPADVLPRLLDPPEGFIVTANNRTLGRDYPFIIGHNWALGYRAYRIAEMLRQRNDLTEHDLLAMQLDTRAGVYDFYQQLALDTLSAERDKDLVIQEIEQVLRAWDGHMHSRSIGAALLNEFRGLLAKEVFAKVVAVCSAYDPSFRYAWREMETPLRILLTQQPKGILLSKYQDNWRQMIVQVLRQAAGTLRQRFPETDLTHLTWGETHTIAVRHPLSRVSSALSGFLDMPVFASDGCASVCVKVMGNGHSASERMVLAPSHPEDAIFHMPGGQSGHPLSVHYRDQEQLWQKGLASPMELSRVLHVLTVHPFDH